MGERINQQKRENCPGKKIQGEQRRNIKSKYSPLFQTQQSCSVDCSLKLKTLQPQVARVRNHLNTASTLSCQHVSLVLSGLLQLFLLWPFRTLYGPYQRALFCIFLSYFLSMLCTGSDNSFSICSYLLHCFRSPGQDSSFV